MKLVIKKNAPLLLAAFAIVLTIGLVSWGQKQSGDRYYQTENDTTPNKNRSDRDKKVRNLDDVLDELNGADMDLNMEKMQKELAEAMKQLDGDKIRLQIEKSMQDMNLDKLQKEMEESMAKVDFDKIKEQMASAMKEFDAAKLQKEIQESMSKVDFDKMKQELASAMKELDAAKLQKEIQESMAKVEWDKMKTEMQRLKEVDMKKLDEDMKKAQEELKDLGPKLEKELSHAKEELEKAKVQVKEFKGFVDDLEKDGLLKKDSYTLKHKDGELFINGKKASEQVYNKYRNFLDKHKNFNIEKTDDDFDMDLD